MKAFLMGLGIGVGLGILFAPDDGEATRNKLRVRVDQWTERFAGQMDNIKKRAEGVKETVGSQADQVFQYLSAQETGESRTGISRKAVGAASESGRDLINNLSREELMSVNGIGPVLADRIISGRPYSSVRELVDRDIIAQSTLEELKRQVGNRLKRPA